MHINKKCQILLHIIYFLHTNWLAWSLQNIIYNQKNQQKLTQAFLLQTKILNFSKLTYSTYCVQHSD